VVDIIGKILFFAVIALVLVGLGAMIRFAFISPRRTKGARQRLRRPDIRGLEALCGFPAPPELVAFYKEAPIVELTEFKLLDHSKTPTKEWMIGTFEPLTLVDTRELLKASGVPGIPFAVDIEKGTYYVDRDGTVRLLSPNVKGEEALVASSISDFAKFEAREDTGDEE
jgi:hypothetical protein